MRGRKRQHVTLRPTIAWRSSRPHNSCVRHSDAAACRYCWGYNGEGELGTCSLSPTAVAVPIRVRRACGVGRVIVACWCPRLLAAAAVVLIERVYHACADGRCRPFTANPSPICPTSHRHGRRCSTNAPSPQCLLHPPPPPPRAPASCQRRTMRCWRLQLRWFAR